MLTTGEGLRWVLGIAVYGLAAAAGIRSLRRRRAAGLPDEAGRVSLPVALVVAVAIAATFALAPQVGSPLRYLIRWAF